MAMGAWAGQGGSCGQAGLTLRASASGDAPGSMARATSAELSELA